MQFIFVSSKHPGSADSLAAFCSLMELYKKLRIWNYDIFAVAVHSTRDTEVAAFQI